MFDAGEMLSIGEAAKGLPFSEASLRQRINRGEVEVVRFAGRIFLPEGALIRAYGNLYHPRNKAA